MLIARYAPDTVDRLAEQEELALLGAEQDDEPHHDGEAAFIRQQYPILRVLSYDVLKNPKASHVSAAGQQIRDRLAG